MAHCRGEFIAIYEGDDFWIDLIKLQKQVDVMRKYQNVGVCYCKNNKISLDGKEWHSNVEDNRRSRLIPSDEFVDNHIFSWNFKGLFGCEASVAMTISLFRLFALNEAIMRFDIFKWRLHWGGEQNYLGVGCLFDVYFIQDEMAVYRRNEGSAVSRLGGLISCDYILVHMYFDRIKYNLDPSDISYAMLDNFRFSILRSICMIVICYCTTVLHFCNVCTI